MRIIEEVCQNVIAIAHVTLATGRSWRPAGCEKYEAISQYLHLSGENALLVDTGVKLHRESIVSAVSEIVGSRNLTIMVSRSELDSIGNVGALSARFPNAQFLNIMKTNPLMGMVELVEGTNPNAKVSPVVFGEGLGRYGFPHLRPVEPVIRTLSTSWMIDELNCALLTSDFFSADMLDTPGEPIVRKSAEGRPNVHEVRKHVLAKFDWLAYADLTELKLKWDSLFREQQFSILAPGLGKLQSGRQMVSDVISDYHHAVFDAHS